MRVLFIFPVYLTGGGSPTAQKREVSVRITNVGGRPGWAVPQLYLHRIQGITTSRIRQLCGFEKIELNPGQSRAVTIPVPDRSLIQWDWEEKPQIPGGKVEWFLADRGKEHLKGAFNL